MRADSRRTHQLLLDPFNSHREFFRNAAGELVQLRAVRDQAVLDIPGALERAARADDGRRGDPPSGTIHFSDHRR